MRINFGCGGTKLPGWLNTDYDPAVSPDRVIDITHPLPFEDNSVDFITSEHNFEHIRQDQGYDYLIECMRILKSGGVVRVATPDIEKIVYEETEAYRNFQKIRGWGNGAKGCGLKSILKNHGHQCVYSQSSIKAMFFGAGFVNINFQPVGESTHEELKGVEGHGRVIGDEFNNLETMCVEGTKP